MANTGDKSFQKHLQQSENDQIRSQDMGSQSPRDQMSHIAKARQMDYLRNNNNSNNDNLGCTLAKTAAALFQSREKGVYSAVISIRSSKSRERYSRASQRETEAFWKKNLTRAGAVENRDPVWVGMQPKHGAATENREPTKFQ